MSECVNGGTAITINGTVWKLLNGYSSRWEDEYGEGFENYDFSRVEEYKGRRYYADISVYKLSENKKNMLVSLLHGNVFSVVLPDFSGDVKITALSIDMTSSNFYGTYYNVAFSIAAVMLLGSGGL